MPQQPYAIRKKRARRNKKLDRWREQQQANADNTQPKDEKAGKKAK